MFHRFHRGGLEGAMVVHDLVRAFPAAEVRREVAFLDLGTPEARPHLIRGWGLDERDEDHPFVWGLSDESELEFFAARSTDVTAVLHCRAFDFDEAPRQTVSVALNGRDLATVEVGREFAHLRVELPAGNLRQGSNRLLFRYRRHHRPREVIAGSADDRPLAVQWVSIELWGLGSESLPRLARSTAGGNVDDLLEIPLGSQVSYFFDLEPGQELVIGDLTAWGSENGLRLQVQVETETGETDFLLDPGEDRAAGEPIRVPFDVPHRDLGRVSLSAVSENAGGKTLWHRLLDVFGRRGDTGVSLLLPMVIANGAPPVSPLPPRRAGPPERVGSRAEALRVAGEGRRPDVIVYLIDTLRADHLGLYGYDRPTSPEIDRFAEDAVVFRNAQAQSSWTRSSVVSLMTGLLPQVHGVNRRDDALSRSVDTLAEILHQAGYLTAGFVTNGNVSKSFGLGQGFDHYRYLPESRGRVEFHILSDGLNRQVFKWLEPKLAPHQRKPFFLYVHSTDPHAPYTPREPFRQRFAAGVDARSGHLRFVHDIAANRRPAPEGIERDFIDLYDGEIAFNDHHFGRFVARLKELGVYDSSVILLLADHGEEFLDHGGWEHGKSLYGEQLWIPMVLKLPRNEQAGRAVDSLADQVDVLPTLLEVLGLEAPASVDGRSLGPQIGGAVRSSPSYSYLRLEEKRLRSVHARGWKLILDDSRHRRGGAQELYRVADDRGEIRDLFDGNVLERGFLLQSLRSFENGLRNGGRGSLAEPAELSDELRQRLEALGYVQ